jgi:Fe2+ transport system protein B
MLFLLWGFVPRVSIVLHGVGFLPLSFLVDAGYMSALAFLDIFIRRFGFFNGHDGLLVDIRD